MKGIVKIALLTVVVLSVSCSKTIMKSGQTRPNIIFLLADDLRFDLLGCNGNNIIKTPAIDSMAKNGYNFTQNYVTTSICCISRASILTGQYARRHKVLDFDDTLSNKAFNKTYPQILRNSGYYTGFIGKYGVGNKMPISSFDYWKGFAGHGVYFIKVRMTNPYILLI